MKVNEQTLTGSQLVGLSGILATLGLGTTSYPTVSDGTMNQWIGETWQTDVLNGRASALAMNPKNEPMQLPTHEMRDGKWCKLRNGERLALAQGIPSEVSL